jgi:hypothetical protein
MFRFTIRDVLWLTIVVALGVGWWLDQRQLRIQNRQYLEDQVRAKEQMQQLEIRIDLLAEARRRLNEELLRQPQIPAGH